MILHCTPYSREKKLAQAYNDHFAMIGKDDWCAIRDIDTMYLTPCAPNIIEDYTILFPHAGILTCYTNRISLASKGQLYGGSISGISDIAHHLRIADRLKALRTVSLINNKISGFLMVISKKTWLKHRFEESGLCLGVDNDFSSKILASGKPIFRMNGLYIFHQYRMLNGIANKTHLL